MPDKQLFTFRNPVGVVAVITAGNFPVAVPSWYLVPALLVRQQRRLEAGRLLRGVSARRSTSCSSAAAACPTGCSTWCYADGAATFAGLSQALEAGLVDKVGFTGSARGRLGDRRADRPPPADGLPRARRQEPDGGHARAPTSTSPSEGALFSGFGTAGQRCTSLGTVIVHERVHDEFLARFDTRLRRRRSATRREDVVIGPMLDAKFADRFEEYLDWIQPHHTVLGSAATGRITA